MESELSNGHWPYWALPLPSDLGSGRRRSLPNPSWCTFRSTFPRTANAETMACCELGGSWTRTRPAVERLSRRGVLAYGEEGVIVIDVAKQGCLKRTLQPNYLSISSHWMRNVGTQPYQIHLDMDMCGMGPSG